MKPIGIFFSKSRNSLRGHWGMAALATFCMLVLIIAVSIVVAIFFGNPRALIASGSTFNIIMGIIAYLVFFFAVFPVVWSYNTMFLSMVRGEEISVSDLFNGYSDITRVTWGYILIAISQFLVACLIGFILGIVMGPFSSLMTSTVEYAILFVVLWSAQVLIALAFSQYAYILYDDEDISSYNALVRSFELMKGHKLLLFVVSFILGVIVVISVLPVGIGLLFSLPYVATVNAHFYESLIEKEDVSEEQPEGDYEEFANV